VSPDWIRKSSEQGSWLPEQDFLLRDPEVNEAIAIFSLNKIIAGSHTAVAKRLKSITFSFLGGFFQC
jgi:hypothetical protein